MKRKHKSVEHNKLNWVLNTINTVWEMEMESGEKNQTLTVNTEIFESYTKSWLLTE